MSDASLRKNLIKLAHDKPELRPHLLPLITEGSRTAKKVTMKDLKKDMAAAQRVFKSLQSANQKAEDKYGEVFDYMEDAGSKPSYYNLPKAKATAMIKDAQEQVMTLGMEWLKSNRKAEKKMVDAIRKFAKKIDSLGKLEGNAKDLRKDLDRQLQEIEGQMKVTPKDWKEMRKALERSTGPRLFSYAAAYMSRLVEAVTGEML